ncbi:hypothetical protein [Streptomyces sp. NPDC002209]|uniref:hypothetical protein n=1 Tax=Streptomyces sp. NPDC002209 TaxID=3364638 RepID=UPI00367825EC
MNTFLDYLAVLAVAALLLGPALHGALRERRIDRQLRAAPGHGHDEAPPPRTPVTRVVLPMGGDAVKRLERAT